MKVQPIRGFKKDIEKYLEVKITKVIESMNDKDKPQENYGRSYNYMIDQFMQLTIEKHASKRDNKKGLEAIKEESKFEEESDDSIERFDSGEMMQKMDDMRT